MAIRTSHTVPGMRNSKALNYGAPPGFQKHKPMIDMSEKQWPADIDLVAIVSTWFDADIIAHTVRACIAHGASQVLIVDNDSPDNSVETAIKSGAKLAMSYSTEFYDDDLRIRHVNNVARYLVSVAPKPVWVMSLDADEIPCHKSGRRIIDVLSEMPPDVRVVGSNCIDVYPHANDWVLPDTHPAKTAVHGCFRSGGRGKYCDLGHWKHVLLKYYPDQFDLAQTRGNHGPASDPNRRTDANEANDEVFLFHVPLRNMEQMKQRLTALCGGGKTRRSVGDDEITINNGAIARFRNLESIYAQRWNEVELPHPAKYGRPITGIVPYPVSTICPWIMNDAGVKDA